ncbi:hypothetical protein FVEN_g12796 [Fusarium venenatum]|uniref:uncharacterized protein n=1 Tax=Fusarium venenatum TaxID=56646 RepID=UPI001DB5C2E3|nr:hypothetical protein FVEN_g12796 [Fusarium venenatum]KAH6994005.1 hypothetical protein EDB82DRAFT_556240 [Fusarium venenatum]
MDEDPDYKGFGFKRVPCCCLCGAKICHKDVLPKWMSEFRTVYATDFDANAKVYLSIAGRRGNNIVDTIDVDPSDIACLGKKTLRVNLMPGGSCSNLIAGYLSSNTLYEA